MTFPEDEQQTAPALDPSLKADSSPQTQSRAGEPRLLTRTERDAVRSQGTRRPAQADVKKRSASEPRPRARVRTAPQTGRRKSKHLKSVRVLLGVALSCAVLLVLCAAGAVLYFRHAMSTALPQIDGNLHVAGLHAPVTVARDTHGVPAIAASNLPDLLFAQGYVTAGDRLWQMDALRRHAAGELAEVLGPSMVEHDRRQRYLQIRAAADRAVAQLPADQLAQLQAYALGVNAYIESHSNALPLQFRMLSYTPSPWTPRDSLLVSLAMWQDLSTEFPRKMDREALSAHLDGNLLPDLYPVGSWRDQPPSAQGRDITAPHVVEQIPLDPSQSRLQPPGAAPADLLAVSKALAGSGRCEGCRSGSNNWAVSGTHTASGAPMVSNDMHLSLSIPDIWYEASLHADLGSGAAPDATARMDVTGFTLPGVPFVIVGRNAQVAWGVTNLGADVQDLRVEHLRGSGAGSEYEQADGTWAPVAHRTEVIRVRGARNVTLDVETTKHQAPNGEMETPLISPLYPGEQRALSLAWTAYDPAAVNSPFFGANTAQDGPSLVASLAHFGGPSLNLVWADSAGHIGYHALGMIPVRGPAVQHPRAMAAPVQQGPPPPDEGTEPVTDEGSGPAARLADVKPSFVLSAFYPRPRRPSPHVPSRRPRPVPVQRRIPVKAVRATQPAPSDALPPTPAPINYTVGSPLSTAPVDALDAQQAWTAYVPYNSLPAVVDPASGFLTTANARITADDYPYALAVDWADPFRVERIVHLLAGSKGLTADSMLGIQTDAYSDVNRALAQRLAYAVDHASTRATGSDANRLRDAANLLRDWDGRMRTGSSAAAIVSAARKALWPALLVPQIEAHDNCDEQHAVAIAELYTWGERTSALELLVQHEPVRWLPKGFSSWNDFLAATLASGLKEAHAPGNLGKWQYGQVHTVEISDPVFGAHRWLSRAVGVRATSGQKPAPGDATTIDAIGAHFGPSERFTADLGYRLDAPEGALGNITTGQSGNARSPWYFDQFRTWLDGRTFALSGPSSEAAHTLILEP
jgi:penicillin G amidase